MALTQVIPELDGDVERAADWPDAFNAAVRARESLDYTAPITAASYDVQVGDHVVVVDGTSNAVQLNLPDADDCPGRVIRVKVISVAGGNTTIEPDGAQTIDGASNVVISAQWGKATLYAFGGDWLLL